MVGLLKMFLCCYKQDENRHTLTDGMDSPLTAAECTRGDHARSDELMRDKEGLWDGRGLKK